MGNKFLLSFSCTFSFVSDIFVTFFPYPMFCSYILNVLVSDSSSPSPSHEINFMSFRIILTFRLFLTFHLRTFCTLVVDFHLTAPRFLNPKIFRIIRRKYLLMILSELKPVPGLMAIPLSSGRGLLCCFINLRINCDVFVS